MRRENENWNLFKFPFISVFICYLLKTVIRVKKKLIIMEIKTGIYY